MNQRRYCDNTSEWDDEHPRMSCEEPEQICCHFCKRECKFRCPNIEHWKYCIQRVNKIELMMLKILCSSWEERNEMRKVWRGDRAW